LDILYQEPIILILPTKIACATPFLIQCPNLQKIEIDKECTKEGEPIVDASNRAKWRYQCLYCIMLKI